MVAKVELERRIWTDVIIANSRATFGLTLLTPFWASLFALALSGPVPELGQVPIERSIWWIVLATLAAGFRVMLDFAFSRGEAKKWPVPVKVWLLAYGLSSMLVSSSWASGFWFLYQPGNTANLLCLMALMMGAVSQCTVARSTHFLAAFMMILPVVVLPVARMATDFSVANAVFMLSFPLWVGLILVHIRRNSRDIIRTYRLRFQNEALAKELTRARDEALSQRKCAEEANRTKSAFLANMSHELRTPLNAIMGFSEIIEQQALGPDQTEKYREYARDIHVSGRHLLSLINDLLDIAKIEAGRIELLPAALDTEAVLDDAICLLEPTANAKHITLTASCRPNAAELRADERALKQILFNLLSNAIKFSMQGGHVDLSARRLGDGVMLSVADHGIGIPEDQVERLFLPFEQLENAYGKSVGGTGLGLTLVRKLSELHGGYCRLQSTEGVGTLVEVWLPDKADEALLEADFASVQTDRRCAPDLMAAAGI